ncbi:flagellar protofilament ribbon protein [Tritrichomonas foetus]|uniref:Flagellar protofilament ribbon protein n=1 Tax=Tritrichomonas foetus TaxID=1144522 RepID=A0A1J4KNX7_9EUKA|nr:flagellar protofilament ribbon protein [Tritrichomonas foetus]|eukprot:OHT11500.1 flagellar protofilament ribbon protein [Tritrichomonas foetus]
MLVFLVTGKEIHKRSMNLPKLPGYSFHDPRKTDYRKGQMLTVTSGLMGQRQPQPEELERSVAFRSEHISTRAPPREPVSTFPDYIPAHVAYEHLVLRFYAFFKETIPESNEELFRIRYVKIYVYLEDDTIMIEENHIRNSGMTQGVLLRRMKVVNPDIHPEGTMYKMSDFNVGISLEMYGIIYRIYACDKFTEEFFQSSGMHLNEFETPPDDVYNLKRTMTDRPIRVTYMNTDKTNLRRFLDFDGKVLRFYAIWDDRQALFGEKRNFVFHFFLVDGTIEIRQILPVNSGRDPVSQFLKRTLLLKPGTDEYYQDSDLYIGQRIEIFNRTFLLYDADPYTKDFLDNKYGKHDWTPLKLDEKGALQQKTEKVLPPYNGWGNEEDSAGFCNSLHPKPPRKDVVKFITKDGMVLRFSARFKNPQAQDKSRKFVIVFYLADDTLAIFELPQRNSGFRGGKFIQRDKYKNVLNRNQYFTAADLKVGEDVIINNFTFETYEADEFAMNYMEADANNFPQSDLFEIISVMLRRKELVNPMRQEFEKLDPELSGYIESLKAEEIIMKYFPQFQAHEAKTITRRWTDDYGFDYFGLMSIFKQ